MSQGSNVVGNSFSKADRILKRYEFLRLAETGNRVHNPSFMAVFNAGVTDRTRLGITVTKKVGGAVVRSKIKRRVREFFRTHKAFFPYILDINIIAKKEAVALSAKDADNSLHHIFSKISSRK